MSPGMGASAYPGENHMARYRGTTEQRGLGHKHRIDRERLLALHKDGDPCWRCGQPMYKWQDLDRDHVVDRALGGTDGPAVLSHASCNRSAGARLSNQIRPQRTTASIAEGRDTICKTCGERYWYAARTCVICSGHYHPYRSQQRACGRDCGVVLQRRNRIANGWVPPEERPKPARCSDFNSKGAPCRNAATVDGKCDHHHQRETEEPTNGWPVTAIAYYNCRYCGKLGVTRVNAHQQREVCPARECQLARLAANNLVARKGMTREQADAAVTAYRTEGDHRQPRSGRWQPPRRRRTGRRPVMPAVGYAQAQLW
jgi:hypothetical protein